MHGTAPQTLTMDDAQAIEGSGPAAERHRLALQRQRARWWRRPPTSSRQIAGTNAAYFALQRSVRSAQGSLFDETPGPRRRARSWCWAPTWPRTCSATARPSARRVRIKDQTLRVVGVLAPKGGGGFGSVDDQAFRADHASRRRGSSAPARPTATASGSRHPALGAECRRHQRHPGPHHGPAARAAPPEGGRQRRRLRIMNQASFLEHAQQHHRAAHDASWLPSPPSRCWSAASAS